MEIPPNQTLYVNNLNEKLHKDGVWSSRIVRHAHSSTVLKRSLYCLFCQFGPVMDIIAMKTAKMRGQAFVVYRVCPHLCLGTDDMAGCAGSLQCHEIATRLCILW